MNIITAIDERIEVLKKQATNGDFVTVISENNVLKAQEIMKINAYSKVEFFKILASLNLLNAAIKRPEFKKQVSYIEIKGNVSRVLNYLISLKINKYDIDFSINPIEKCAYIEIFNLQFSFHNIYINEKINTFIASERNNIKPWKEIRLQKIAGEIFNLALALNE
jgi:hypothetical protein